MNKHLCILVCLSAINFMTSFAQTISMYPPQIIPVSPEAADIQRYASYPVDYSTGIPDIRIPLYEIKVGDIVLPITLSYHSAGLKPKEPSGRVGAGWTLNAEPSVMRSIRGLPDGSLTFNNSQALTKKKAQEIIEGKLDGEPDAYSYTLNPGGGSFYRASFQPYNYISYPRNNDDISMYNDLFTIYTGEGLIYRFGSGANAKEKTESTRLNSQTTRWLCHSISSLKTKAEITFSYLQGSFPRVDYYYNMHGAKIIEQIRGDGIGDGRDKKYNWLGDTSNGTLYLLSAIENNGKLQVKKSSLIDPVVQDKGGNISVQRSIINVISFNGHKVQFFHKQEQGNDYVTDMIVKDANNNQIRWVQFFTSRYNENTRLIKLDSIRISAPGNEIRTYCFDYYNKASVPNDETRGIDHWSFYNGANNSSGVPTIYTKLEFSKDNGTMYPLITDTIPGANREPNATYSKYGMLSEIIYPEGMVANFEYEGNAGAFLVDYRGDNYEDNAYYAHPVGGLRIAKITESILLNKYTKQIVSTRRYKYGLNRYVDSDDGPIMGGGVIKHIVTNRDYCFESKKKWYYTDGSHYVKTWQSMPISNITFNNGSAVFYTFVQEEVEDKKTGIKIKSKYYYDMPPHDSSVLDYDNQYHPTKIATGYWDLLTKQESAGYANSRIVRKRIDRPYDLYEEFNTDNDWKHGHLIKSEHYSMDTLVSSVFYTYDYYTRNLTTNGQVWVCKPYCIRDYIAYTDQQCNYINPGAWPIFSYETLYPDEIIEKREYVTGSWMLDVLDWKALKSETERQYFYRNGIIDTITIVKNYQYNDYTYHINPTGITSENFSRVQKDEYTYHENMVNTLSSHKKTVNNSVVESKIEFNGNRPQKVRMKTNNMTVFDDKIIYDRYDHYGNIAEISTNDGKHTCYIWSYGNQYPIVEIDNITYTGLLQALSKDTTWIRELGNKYKPSEQDMNLLNGLRNQLTASQVKTFTYQPLFGVTGITDSYGFTTSYKYDNFGRLIETSLNENGSKKTLQENKYHLMNNSTVASLINPFFITGFNIEPGIKTLLPRDKSYLFKVYIQDGSGSFKYTWELYYDTNNNVSVSIKTMDTNTNQVTLTPQFPPEEVSNKINKLKVKVTDTVTGISKESAIHFYVL